MSDLTRDEAAAICAQAGLKLADDVTDGRSTRDILRDVEGKLDKVLAISERVESIATSVADQVKPVLDDLMKSPLLKMLGVKTK